MHVPLSRYTSKAAALILCPIASAFDLDPLKADMRLLKTCFTGRDAGCETETGNHF